MLDQSKLVLSLPGGQEQEFVLSKAHVTLGRASANDVVLRDSKVSRAHIRLDIHGGGCTLVDLGSANSTRVNGVRAEQAVLLPGDVIAVGDSILRYEIAPPRTEPDLTAIDSPSDLEATLTQATIPVTVRETQTPRVIVHTSAQTSEVLLTQDVLTIGRDWKNDLVLDDPKASRNHARLERRGDSIVLRDLTSTNGTWLGEQRIEEHTLLPGDTIRIGATRLIFQAGFAEQDLTLGDAGPLPGQAGSRRPILVVPGFMGSELWRGSERLWPNTRLLFTQPEALRYGEDASVESRGLVKEVVIVPNVIKFEEYDRLGDYLVEELGYERGKDLIEFAFDWRQDVRESSREPPKRWMPGTSGHRSR